MIWFLINKWLRHLPKAGLGIIFNALIASLASIKRAGATDYSFDAL